jgi:hypothetical protein
MECAKECGRREEAKKEVGRERGREGGSEKWSTFELETKREREMEKTVRGGRSRMKVREELEGTVWT